MKSDIYIRVENLDQIEYLADLAREIWINYFESMIEKDTLEYLIDQVQSKDSISSQIKDGYSYFFIQIDDKYVGYFAYKLYKDKSELFLSKLYILSSERRKGIGKEVINYLEEICRAKNITKLFLTVFYKNVNAIKSYEKTGFQNTGLIKRDIGKGIVINDYRMEKII